MIRHYGSVSVRPVQESEIYIRNIFNEIQDVGKYIADFRRVADSLSFDHDIFSLENPGYVLFAVSTDSSGYIFYDYLCDCGCGKDKRSVLRFVRKKDSSLVSLFYKPGFYRIPYINPKESERR